MSSPGVVDIDVTLRPRPLDRETEQRSPGQQTEALPWREPVASEPLWTPLVRCGIRPLGATQLVGDALGPDG